MKIIRAQVSDEAYERLLRIQGKQQAYTSKRATISTALTVAIRIANSALLDDDSGAESLLDLEDDGEG